VDDFSQQVAKFVFNVSNILVSQESMLPLACEGRGALCHAPRADPKNKKMYKQFSAVYTKMFNFRQKNTILFRKTPFKAQNDYIF